MIVGERRVVMTNIEPQGYDTSAADGKHPVTTLAGPYGHPFHPILVTVPIGAWVAALVFDIISRAGDDGVVYTKGAYWLIGIGIVGALVAAVFGFLDLLAIPRGTQAFRTGLTHMALNLVVVVLFAASFAVRAANGYEEFDSAGFVLSLLAIAVLGASGWLGGELAYRYGVRVADEQTQ